MRKIQTSHIWYTIFALSLLLINHCKASNIKLTNLKCTGISKNVGNFEICNLKAVKRDVVELNVHFAMALKNVSNASITVRLIKRGDTFAQNALYQFKVDVCAFFRNTKRNPLANLFYSVFEFEKYSNMNHSCPYNHDLILKGCRVNTMLLGVLAISPGEYTISSSWFFLYKHAGNVDISIVIT